MACTPVDCMLRVSRVLGSGLPLDMLHGCLTGEVGVRTVIYPSEPTVDRAERLTLKESTRLRSPHDVDTWTKHDMNTFTASFLTHGFGSSIHEVPVPGAGRYTLSAADRDDSPFNAISKADAKGAPRIPSDPSA